MGAYFPVLVLHVLAGSVALISGPIPMFSEKGKSLHRTSGLVYFGAMVVTTLAGFALAVMRNDILLLAIAVFSFFLVFAGFRATRALRGHAPDWWDQAVAGATLLFSIGLFLWGLPLLTGHWNVPALFFGGIGGRIAFQHLQDLRAPAGVDWLNVHFSSMGGGYIATVTAALLVNIDFLPSTVVFIVPTLIGSLLLARATRKYARPKRA